MFEDGAFDVFREFGNGSTLWIASVRALPDAESHMSMMARHKPGRYFISHDGKQLAHVDSALHHAG